MQPSSVVGVDHFFVNGKDLYNDHHGETKVIANSEAGVTVCLPAARGGKLK